MGHHARDWRRLVGRDFPGEVFFPDADKQLRLLVYFMQEIVDGPALAFCDAHAIRMTMTLFLRRCLISEIGRLRLVDLPFT